jgi:hypothetical protein
MDLQKLLEFTTDERELYQESIRGNPFLILEDLPINFVKHGRKNFRRKHNSKCHKFSIDLKDLISLRLFVHNLYDDIYKASY